MCLATITRDIISGDYSNDELNKIAEAVKFARAQITQKNRRSLVVGTKVKFTSSRAGGDITGTVEKVAIKFVTVRSSSGLWKVPANMLSVA
jgi:hypothetical protein